MRALVVANPAATSTNTKVRDVLVGALGSQLKVDLAETTHRGHARELGREARADGVDVVVALGGDGTVNEVVNGLLHDGPGADVPTLAVVPGGSTNVFSRALGRSRDPVEATAEILDSIRAGRTRRVSLGTASASGTSTAPVEPVDPAAAPAVAAARRRRAPGVDRPALVRLHRRSGLRRRRHRPGGGRSGPAAGGPPARCTSARRRRPSCSAASGGARP